MAENVTGNATANVTANVTAKPVSPAWRDPLSIGWQAHRRILLLRLRWHTSSARRRDVRRQLLGLHHRTGHTH